MHERHEFVVSSTDDGKRIDLFLAAKLPHLSRRKVRSILDVGGCYVNNKRMHIASRTVRSGDKIKVEFSVASLSKAKQKKFVLEDKDILFLDDHIVAINKPAGLPSQATRDQDIMHAEVCLIDWLKENKKTFKPLVLVHRLDKETSGILLFARSNDVATKITDYFRNRTIKKTYWALSSGNPLKHQFKPSSVDAPELNFTVECFLSDIDKRTGMVSIVKSGGRKSKTDFSVVSSNQTHQVHFIECRPETGRSHQIRVHLASVGLGILGDKRYSESASPNLPKEVLEAAGQHQMLHARELFFLHPVSGENVTITAEPPETFSTIVNSLLKS